MQTTKSARFIPHLIAAELKQRLQSLTFQAEYARSVRDFAEVGSIAHSLRELALPRELEGIALYYQACADKESAGPEILRTLTESPLSVLRARAHLALGTNALGVSDLSLANRCYQRARAAFAECDSPDLIGVLHLSQVEAISAARSNDHPKALSSLQGLWGLTRVVMRSLPVVGYVVMNSVATELGANGQPEFAAALIERVVESPFVRIYPEWLETREEISRLGQGRRLFPGGEAPPDTSRVPEITGYYERRRRDREKEIDNIRSRIIQSVSNKENMDLRSGQEILQMCERVGSGRTSDLNAARSFLRKLEAKNRRQSEG